MKVLKVLLKTDIYGEPVSIRHVNLLPQKTTADDDETTLTNSASTFISVSIMSVLK